MKNDQRLKIQAMRDKQAGKLEGYEEGGESRGQKKG